MTDLQPRAAEGLSESERTLLRDSVRELLARRWPVEGASKNADDSHALGKLWREFAEQGFVSVGSSRSEVGLREIILIFEELGRASCLAPLLGAVGANIVLASAGSDEALAFLEDLHRGDAMVALVLAAFDGDRAAGRIEIRGQELFGKASFVEGAQLATHFLVFTDAPFSAAIIVEREAPGLKIKITPGLAAPALAEVTFERTPGIQVHQRPAVLVDAALVAQVACAGRALGAARRGFELAVDHAKLRKQFGQFIGQFQAIQHKLANCLISLDGATLTLDAAAEAYDKANPNWRVFAASALAFAGPALRAVSIETHRALGAVGYAEEHEAPRHFRRVHADLARFGGVMRARAELADFLLGPAQ